MRTTVRAKALVLACALAIAAVAASTAFAAALLAGTWQPFSFGVTGSTATGSPFTFSTFARETV